MPCAHPMVLGLQVCWSCARMDATDLDLSISDDDEHLSDTWFKWEVPTYTEEVAVPGQLDVNKEQRQSGCKRDADGQQPALRPHGQLLESRDSPPCDVSKQPDKEKHLKQ